MGIKFISYVPSILGVLSIAFFVLQNNPKNIRNRVFFFTNTFIGLWLFFLFLADISTNPNLAVWFFRLGLFWGSMMILFFFYFSLVFPFQTQVKPIKIAKYSAPIIIMAFLLLTPLGVSSVTIEEFGAQPHNVGFVYPFSDFLGVFYLVIGILILLRKYKKSNLQQKNQIKFVLFGLFVAALTNIFTGIVLTLSQVETNFILFGGFSLFIFSLFVAYAMVRHSFFDIRPLVARSAAYILLLSTVAATFAGLVIILPGSVLGAVKPSTPQQIYYTVAAIILAFGFQPLKIFFNKITNNFFYQDAYDPQGFLNELNQILASTIELKTLLRKSSDVIERNLKPEYSAFAISETSYEHGRVIGNGSHISFRQKDISEIIAKTPDFQSNVLVTAYLEDSQKELRSVLSRNNVVVLAKLTSTINGKADEVGYLLLGGKKSGNPYSSQDIRMLEIIANELVIAIQNALRFEEIAQFNITLQERVDEATRQLRRTNERLRLLDETKDDFISMASHQLRTPLTSVKGYLSMTLEGDAGKISPKQEKLLNQAFISSQRMVYLIADLLNVSRLRTGKFVVEALPVNLGEVIESEVGQLVETAAARGLKLKYERPKSFPTLMLDETKIRQVIMNFIDNAIYYTPSGGHIWVGLSETEKSIEFTVKDDGIGVPKHEQHHLFTKFFRAGNAKKARPDGTGLGLFMAKKVIIAQGGSLVFSSQEHKGSTFGFTFAKARLLPSAKKDQPTEDLTPSD